MRGMILAAGLGQRMGEYVHSTPKPLLRLGDAYLIEYSIRALARAGIREIVINTFYLADQIEKELGDGQQYGVKIYWSRESELLETGGGIVNALPFLGDEPFVVVSADVVTDYPFARLIQKHVKMAHLVFVDNPVFHPAGDFSLLHGQVVAAANETKTYANIGVFHPACFAGYAPHKFRLADILKKFIAAGQVTGEVYQGKWHNIGTPEALWHAESDAAVIWRAREDSNL